MSHENIPIVLYRNQGKEGLFAETFLKPLKIRKPNEAEALDVDKVTLKQMMEEAYRPPEKEREGMDVQGILQKHKKNFTTDSIITNIKGKISITNIVIALTGATATIIYTALF